MISNYTYFLLESKGISDIVIKYSDYLYSLYKNFGFSKIKKDFIDKDFEIRDVAISFVNDSNISSRFFIEGLKKTDNGVLGFNFIFSIKSDVEREIKSDFIHELTHAYEFYNLFIKLKSIPFYSVIKKALIDSKLSAGHPFEVFTHYIYLTLDNELNARVSETYPFLISLDTSDRKILINELKNTLAYKSCIEMIDFDVERMCVYLINNIGNVNTCKLINELNTQIVYQAERWKKGILKSYVFLKDTVDEDNLNLYFTKWDEIFKDKAKKHLKKLIGLIDKVIMDYYEKHNYSS